MTKGCAVHHRVPIASIFLTIGLGGELLVLEFIPSSEVIAGAWSSSLIALGAIWGFVFSRYRGKLPLQSNILVTMGFTVLFLVPPMYLSLFLEQQPMLDIWSISDMYPLVAFSTLLGASAFLFGYEALIKPDWRASPTGYTNGESSSLRMSFLLIIIGVTTWSVRGIALSQGIYYTAYQNTDFYLTGWNSILVQTANYGLVLPILLWLLSDRGRGWRRWAWFFTTAEFVWLIPSGSAGPIFNTLFVFLLVAWWRGSHCPKRWLAAVFLAGLVTIPIIREYRYTIGEFVGTREASVEASVSAYIDAKERVDVGIADRGNLENSDRFFSRLFDGQYFGYLLKHYRKSYVLEWGRTYSSRLPFVFIPYFLYTDRPIMAVAINEWFDLVVGSAPATMLGEAYVNFGFAGIPTISFLLGMIMAIYDRLTIRRYGQDVLVVAVYLLFGGYMTFTLTVAGFANILATLRNIVLMMVALELVFRALPGRIGSGCPVPSNP